MKIRKATKKDLKDYRRMRKEGLIDYQRLTKDKLSLSEKQIEKEFEDIFSNKNRIMFVAEDKEGIKAYIFGMLMKNSSAYIDDIFVEKSSRKKGIGKKLMSKFKKWSKFKKAKKIRLGVRANNQKAINLYKKIGFEIKYYEMEQELK